MKRDTLLDFFADFADLPDLFLVYDDGFRVEQRSYRQTAQAARALATAPRSGRSQGRQSRTLERKPAGMGGGVLGLPAGGAIVVPVDYRASAAFLLRIRDRVEARVVWIGDEVVWPEGADPQPWRLAEVDWSDARTTAIEAR